MLAYIDYTSRYRSSYADTSRPIFKLDPFHVFMNKGNEVAVVDDEDDKKSLLSFEEEEEDWSDTSV
jgi:hypothetical protein